MPADPSAGLTFSAISISERCVQEEGQQTIIRPCPNASLLQAAKPLEAFMFYAGQSKENLILHRFYFRNLTYFYVSLIYINIDQEFQ
jgi:hypothetical protein